MRRNSHTLYFLLSFILFLLSTNYSFCSSSHGDTTQKYFLAMKGQVVIGKKYLSKAFIRIYADSSSTPIQKLESDIEGYVAFQLPLQKLYIIKISKQGFVTKIITVDAHLPKSKETGNYYFEFALELFENIEGLDVSMLKNPIAKVFFNTFTKKFDYDFNYTAKINNDLKKNVPQL